MRAVFAIAVVGALGACSSAREPAQEQPTESPAAGVATVTPTPTPDSVSTREPAELVPASQLVGEWRIAGVDGQSIDLPNAITASITEGRIHVVADCVNLGWTYAAEGGVFEAKRTPVESCLRGLTPEEEAIARAIEAATGFGRTPSNAIEIFSREHRVTLYSQ